MDAPQFWALAVGACSALAILGKHPSRMPLHWGCKPLPVLLLITAVCLYAPPAPTTTWIVIALGWSLVGDVVLMMPQRFFVLGLLAFLLGLVSYTIGFSLNGGFTPMQLGWLAIPGVPALWVLRTLWPHIGKLRGPITFYVITMAAMVWRILARWDAPDVSTASWLWATIGGACFMTSDSLLALRRFAKIAVPYPLELGPYFAAQWCLAAAVWS